MAKAPGKSHRTAISLVEIMDMFPDNETAEAWFAKNRWPDGVHCPACGSDNVQVGTASKTQPYRCRERECRRRFSVKTGSVMQNSNLPYRTWAIAVYLSLTDLKGVSSMKLHRDLKITQKSAWHLAHRLREAFKPGKTAFSGPIEADETYVGGKLGNMTAKRRQEARQKPDLGKMIVAGVKDRASGAVSAQTVEYADKPTLQGFVRAHAADGAAVYTDESNVYQSLPNHEAVNHGAGEYVRGDVHIQGIEAFWSMFKRGHKGTFHKMSPKHLDRYVSEFAGRHNIREKDTIDQMTGVAAGMVGKRLRYQDLIADNGLDSGARG